MDIPLFHIGAWLRESGYHFVTPTPLTHARVNARPGSVQARELRGVFGWSRPFAPDLLPSWLVRDMDTAGLLVHDGAFLRSKVRFSSLCDQLFAHSAFPTDDAGAVFFGPDTYRFASLIQSELVRSPLRSGGRILDVGCGAGPGGIVASQMAPGDNPLVLCDINPLALTHARANAQLAGMDGVDFALGDLYAPVDGEFDLIVANPPYLVDAGERTYRHGGGRFGEGLAGRIVTEGLPRLAPGGRLVLYSGSAVVDGADTLLEYLRAGLQAQSWPFTWRELDPDVFGEELVTPAYAQAERIAAVALVVQRPS